MLALLPRNVLPQIPQLAGDFTPSVLGEEGLGGEARFDFVKCSVCEML